MNRLFLTLAATAAALVAALGPARAMEIQRVESPGGIEAWLVEQQAIPIVTIRIGFRGGANVEPDEEAGLARFFAGMLDEGAGDYDSSAFSDRADELAARFSFSAGQDQISVGASMLVENRDETLELLRLALTEPRFDAEPLERVRAQLLAGIRQRETDPDSIAGRAWFSAQFPDDPYGRPVSGSAETVAAIGADDLRAAKARLLARDGMKIGVVGAITAEELSPILDTLLGGLAETGAETPPATTLAGRSGVMVEPFDAPQSTVMFGHAGPLREDPDFIPAYVMNYILGGGGFSSRLTEEVREKRGLAYSVYSYLTPYRRAGVYIGGVATANERVAESIEVITSEWRRLAEEGVTAEELEKAKTYLTGAYPLRFDSNGEIASFLVSAQMSDLGIDYANRRNGLIDAVTREDIQRVAAKWLKPEDLFFVVVGSPEGLAGQGG